VEGADNPTVDTNITVEDTITKSKSVVIRSMNPSPLIPIAQIMSLVPQDKIYKKTIFSNISFLSNYTIKTVERTYSLKQSFETIQLLGSDEIDKNIKKTFHLYILV
jgi:hypothetical protein